jgi:hypothetical protein
LEFFNRYLQIGKPFLKKTHVAGDKMFVDFTGEKLHLVDENTGEVAEELEVFDPYFIVVNSLLWWLFTPSAKQI